MSCILQPEIKVKSFIGDGIDSGVVKPVTPTLLSPFLGFATYLKLDSLAEQGSFISLASSDTDPTLSNSLTAWVGLNGNINVFSVLASGGSNNSLVVSDAGVIVVGVAYRIQVFTTIANNREFDIYVNGIQINTTRTVGTLPSTGNLRAVSRVGIGSSVFSTTIVKGEIWDTYYSIDTNFSLPSSIAQYAEAPNPQENNRPFYTGKELFTQIAPDALPSAWLGGAVQGEVIVQPEIIDPNCINRDPHKFDSLNWVVSVTSEGEPFLNLDGVETQSFNFCTIPENETYFTIPDSFNYVDQDLRVETIQNGFSDGIHKNSLAPIPTASFSISNLELFYHRLCEINGDDLNVFEGAKIEIYMVNGLNPLVVWDSEGEVWNKFDNTLSDVQEQRPTIISPNYPTNEEGYLVFTGTIEDIGFSTQTTSFDCLGVADKINVSLGNLIDPLAQKKDRGGIFPITFGDWSSENDLMPIVLNRNQENVPKIILGEYAHDELNSVRLYDKVSEKDFEVKNDFTIATDKNIVQFKNETATDTLGKALNDDINTYDESQQITNLRNSLFQNPNTGTVATKQALYSVGDELIAYHTPRREPTASYLTTYFGNLKGQISASRGWGGQGVTNHEASAELFEIDSEYQKAIALIDIAPKITGLYWSGKDVLNPTNTSSCGFTTGSFQNVIDKTSKSETDLAPDLNAFAYAGSDDNEFTTTDFFSFEFEKIGLNGEIIKTDCDYSGWFYGGNDFISPSTSQDYTIAMTIKNLDDSTLIEDQNRLVFTTDIENSDLDLFTRQVKGDYQNLTSYELISPSGGWLKVKYSVDLTTPDLTTLEQLQEGRIGISCDTIDRLTPNSPRNFFDYLNWRFRVKVNAEDGLWFGRGKGRRKLPKTYVKTFIGNGTDAYVDLSDSFTNNYKGLSMSVNVKITQVGNDVDIIGITRTNGDGLLYLSILADGTFLLLALRSVNTAAVTFASVPQQIAVGDEFNISFHYDNSNNGPESVLFYINGVRPQVRGSTLSYHNCNSFNPNKDEAATLFLNADKMYVGRATNNAFISQYYADIEVYDVYWSNNINAIDEATIIQYADGEEHFTQQAPDVLVDDWLGGAVQGEIEVSPEEDGLITSSPNAIKDIMTKELGYNSANFGDITSNRDNFPCAFSLFGKQKKWRNELKNICFSFGIGSYQSFDGKENLIDFDRRTPDAVISPDMVLLSGGLQAINYNFTDRNDLFNEFLIKYKVNPANKDTQAVLLLNESEIKNTEPIQFLTAQQTQALQSKLSRATKRLGLTNNEKKQFLLESDYFRDGETAERMMNLFILWNTSTKAKVKVEGTYSDFFDLDVGFQVIFEENAFGGLPKKIAESQFLVINKTIIPSMDGGGSIELDLIEMPTEGV